MVLSSWFLRAFAKKNKTSSAVKDRFRRTSGGAFKFYPEGHNHNFAKKTVAQQASIRGVRETSGFQTRKIKRLFAGT